MIFQTDVMLKTILEQTLEDIRKNIWLLDYILDQFTRNQFLKTRYGAKQITAAKEWFLNNNINVQLQFSKDKEKFPAIFLTLGSSNEVQDLRTMGDVDTTNLVLMPNLVGQPIPYVIKPFVPTNFDPSTGLVGVPLGTDIAVIAQGMVLVNPSNGNGFVIEGISDGQIQIQPGVEIDASQLGVIPQYRFFTSRLGRSFFEENWNITLATNDPQTLLWLHSITVFGLLRYREFMEHNGFDETHFNSTDIFTHDFSRPDGEEIFCRQITMFGKVQQHFIRGLHRNIESILLRDIDPASVTPENPDGFVGGIKIVSNLNTPPLEENDTNWYTVETPSSNGHVHHEGCGCEDEE
jgi:hypothetical protein